ncbi:uncharacterized protein DUF58 [Natranaerovirga hydrolytica]|uniref:Uncharacterized protein DUF58 n=2 Tax=Natranaerovirga hydrolytica TaxID=680378 RepID=A0A4R1MWW5_9FIRM|nr:uncharacterized protein DUF58 [Natranaerovirga hydrolytica]
MNKNRMVYFCTLILLTSLTFFYRSFLTTIFLYIFLSVPVFSLIHIMFTYWNFKIIHEISEKIIIKGDPVHYTCRVSNPNLLFVYAPMKIKFAYENLLVKKNVSNEFFVLLPGETKAINIPIQCKYRGYYDVGINEIEIMDFFGLIKVKYKGIETIKMLVYPNIEKINFFPIKPVVYENTITNKKNLLEDQTNLFEVKAYAFGDPMNQIHWKLSAKKREWMTKHYSSSLQKDTYLFLDNKKTSLDIENNIIREDLLIEYLVSIAYYLNAIRIPMQLYYEDKYKKYKEKAKYQDWDSIYEALAQVQFLEEGNIDNVIKHFDYNARYYKDHYQSNIIVATQNLKPSTIQLLNHLRLQGFEIIILLTLADNQEEIFTHLNNQKFTVYLLKKDVPLQAIIEGDYYAS